MLKDKPFVRTLAGINLYNMTLLEYRDKHLWVFRCINSKGQYTYFDHNIDRLTPVNEGEPWTFEAAVAQVVLNFLEYQEERVRQMKEQQEKVAAELEYVEPEVTT
jgi:hypothetical protein